MAFDAFLKLDGVEGESTRKGFEKQIELQSFSFGATNASSIGSGGGAATGKATLSSFSFSKETDATSPALFQACCSGKHFPKAKVVFHKSGGDQAIDYLVYEFEQCFIEAINWGGSSGSELPHENVSLAFGKVTITYVIQATAGSKATPIVGSWDVTTVSA